MEEKLVQILRALYFISEEEQNKFLVIFNSLSESTKYKILVMLFKRVENYKKWLKKINKELSFIENNLEEFLEKKQIDDINISF